MKKFLALILATATLFAIQAVLAGGPGSGRKKVEPIEEYEARRNGQLQRVAEKEAELCDRWFLGEIKDQIPGEFESGSVKVFFAKLGEKVIHLVIPLSELQDVSINEIGMVKGYVKHNPKLMILGTTIYEIEWSPVNSGEEQTLRPVTMSRESFMRGSPIVEPQSVGELELILEHLKEDIPGLQIIPSDAS